MNFISKKLIAVFYSLLIVSCDLFQPSDPNFVNDLYDELAYSNAPWVPIRIETGSLGTASLMGQQQRTVKLGYSFRLVFQPDRNYPFIGWQAWVEGEDYSAYWNANDSAGESRVKFVPLNDTGTEVEIFVYEMPPSGKELCIGPIGAASGELSVTPFSGGLGIIFPSRLTGIKQGFPFTMSFHPAAGYPFRGWQIKLNDQVISEWKSIDGEDKNDNGIRWAVQNAQGTDISITIETLPAGYSNTDSFIIGPVGMDNPAVRIHLEAGGMGNITSSGEVSFTARLDFPFIVTFQPSGQYPMYGWQAWTEDGGVLSYRKQDEEEGQEKIKFVPINATDVEVTVLELPRGDAQQAAAQQAAAEIVIGPWGFDINSLTVTPNGGGLGTIFPSNMQQMGIIRQNFPFTMSFQPSADYIFSGWQLRSGTTPEDTVYSTWTHTEEGGIVWNLSANGWDVNWSPKNAQGTEIEITIKTLPENPGPIVVMPLGGESGSASVQVSFNPVWGSANQPGGVIRHGFAFIVEFIPVETWAFTGWRAYSGYTSPDNPGTRLDSTNVTITPLDGGRASVNIITSTDTVYLVPWCTPRPVVIETNPPLINTGMEYSRGQPVRIVFNEAMEMIAPEELFNDGYITLSAQQFVGGTSIVYENVSRHFNNPSFTSGNIITIMPHSGNLPPENLVVTVTVGTKLRALNGNTMSAPVHFSYRIDARPVRNVFIANNVWAIHNTAKVDPDGHDFFYQNAPSERDRRIRKNSGNYEVTLFFTVIPSNNDVIQMPQTPNAVRIVFIEYSNLGGEEPNNTVIRDMEANIVSLSPVTDSAAEIYRNASLAGSSPVYKAVYRWPANYSKPGIIRLVVLPYSNPGEAGLDDAVSAIAGGSYVTVVLDNKPPALRQGGNLNLTLSGHASENNGVFNFNDSNRILNINANFTGIEDNAGFGGISNQNATSNRPWTMDSRDNISWQFRIVTGNTADYTSGWIPLNENTLSIDLTKPKAEEGPGLSSSTAQRQLQIRFKDSLGNETGAWEETEVKSAIRYYDTAKDVWAIHNPAAATGEENFFYQGADTRRDRRLRGTWPDYEVTLYFHIPGTASMPDRVRIAEIDYATLQGNDINTLRRQRDLTPEKFTTTTGTDGIYRKDKPSAGITYYKVTYNWNSANQARNEGGIIRLAVMPYSGTWIDGIDSWRTAIDEGRFVTVVLDNLPPSDNAVFALSGGYWMDGDTRIFNSANKDMTVSANFTSVTDNSGIGIPPAGASQDKPWTMDERNNLEWQYRIIVPGGTPDFTSDWDSPVNSMKVDLAASIANKGAGLSNSSTTRTVQVRYRDGVGNEIGWKPIGQIRFSESAVNVWAIIEPSATSTVNDFFWHGNHSKLGETKPELVDRRLKTNNRVTIYFSIPSTDTDSLPNKLRIAEIHYATLLGNEVNALGGRLIRNEEYAFNKLADNATGADGIYRTNNLAAGTSYYKVTYTLSDLPPEGIIRLAVIPYLSTAENLADTWQTAVGKGNYVTVVNDNRPPSGNAVLTLSGEYWMDENDHGNIHIYNSAKREMTLSANFTSVTDNTGIIRSDATHDKPWTTDGDNIEWRYRIVTGETPNFTSAWDHLTVKSKIVSKTVDLTASAANGGAGFSNSVTTRKVQVQYCDGAENESSWIEVGQIRFSESAVNVWAIIEPSASSTDNKFFWHGNHSKLGEAPLDHDRRLRTNNQVTIYFSIPSTVSLPDKLRIAEIRYATLRGDYVNTAFLGNLIGNEKDASFLQANGATGADLFYRTNNQTAGTSCYKVTHTLSDPPAGIIQLAVIPYQSAASDLADTWQTAVGKGNYVTVVKDNAPPGGGASLSLSGANTTDNGVLVFNPDKSTLTINANFTGISDNVINNVITGIPRGTEATHDKPWTMDEFEDIKWQYRIVQGNNGESTINAITSSWEYLSTNERLQSLTTVNSIDTRNIFLRYQDSLGNISAWSSQSMGRIRYDSTALNAITTWTAEYNEVNDSIDLAWSGQGNSARVEVRVNDTLRYTTAPAASSYRITGIPRINTSNVRSGHSISNVTEYNITLVAVYANGESPKTTFRIWNIPGMSSANEGHPTGKPIVEISDPTELQKINADGLGTGNKDKKYVLTKDIVITDKWTPIGTASNPFMGKFYGNGHTITIQNIMEVADMGLFGVVSGSAIVRDLTVNYDAANVAGPNSDTRFGGIAGNVSGQAQFINVLVSGNLTFNMNHDRTIFVGGITGLLGRQANTGVASTAGINNAYSKLDLTVFKGGSKADTETSAYIGGAVGSIGNPNNGDDVKVKEVIIEGNLVIGNEDSPVNTKRNDYYITGFYAGGLAGSISGVSGNPAELQKSNYREGNIEVWVGDGFIAIGGAVGSSNIVKITDCSSMAEIFEINKKTAISDTAARFTVGGFIGNINTGGEIKNCYSDNPIVIKADDVGDVYGGGFVGRTAPGVTTIEISYCYALGDVRVTGYRNTYAGGFIGVFNDNAKASYCYASGNVYGYNIGEIPGNLFTGGFTGYGYNLSNCYALGNVYADKSKGSNAVFAGGLIGYISTNSTNPENPDRIARNIENCFASGSVLAVCNTAATIYVGGIIGQNASSTFSTIRNNAALGASITAAGTGTKNVGRISGRENTAITWRNNHAFDGMKLLQSSNYNGSNPTPPTSSTTGHATSNGQNATGDDFRRQDIWRLPAPANGAPNASQGLGFSEAHWIFTTVNTHGHPILKDEDGKAMGGQL